MEKKTRIYTVQFTHAEAWVILRALAIANDVSEDVDSNKKADTYPRTWLAERLLRKIQEGEDEP